MFSIEMIISRNGNVLTLLLTSLLSSVFGDLESRKMLDILREAGENFNIAIDENVTLILGTNDSGKKDGLDFIYNRKKSGERTDDLPSVIVGRRTGIVIFDYPAFRSTGDLTLTPEQMLYHKMIMKSARSVRYIFFTPYEPYRSGFENKLQILINHAYKLIPNMTKHQTNVGLIFTNVNYKNERRGDLSELIPRNELLDTIREKASLMFSNLKKGNWRTNGYSSPQKFRQTLSFLSMILRKSDGINEKISSLGTPETRAVIKEWTDLRKFISSIPFSQPDVQEIDCETNNTVNIVVNEINEAVQSCVGKMGTEITKNIMIDDSKMNLDEDYMQFKNIRKIFTELKEQNVEKIGDLITNICTALEKTNMKKFAANLRPLLENKELMDDLESFTGATLTNTSRWLDKIEVIVKHAERLEKWSFFLKTLYRNLPVYIREYNLNVDDIVDSMYIRLMSFKRDIRIKVNEIGLDIIIDTINPGREKRDDTSSDKKELVEAYNDVVDSELGETEAWALTKTLSKSDYQTQVVQKEEKLEIKGLVINASEVLQYMSQYKPSHIEVFAFNTFLLNTDMDLSGNISILCIIAMEWKISGKREILLNGKDAEENITQAANGTDGSPGLPGGPGGSFYGIADVVTGDGKVAIHSVGGRGSNGQDGGNGTDGEDGKFPKTINIRRFTDSAENWNRTNQVFPEEDGITFYDVYHHLTCFIFWDYWRFTGTPGKEGNKGPRGGAPGAGGRSGIVKFISINETSKVYKNDIHGKDGAKGQGGPGGMGGINAKGVMMLCYTKVTHYFCEELYKLMPRKPRAPQGKPGESGKNIVGMKSRDSPIKHKIHTTINRFKAAVREYMTENINNMELERFIFSLEKNKEVLVFYDTFSYIDELKSIEEQFHKLYKLVNFMPFYESLLERINNCSKEMKDEDQKLAVISLNAAILSRIYSIKNNKNSQMIIDVQYFLSKVIQEISVIKKLGKELKNDELEKEQSKEIDQKIEEGQKFVENDFLPRIGMIMENIQRLVNQTFVELEATEKNNKITERQQQEAVQRSTAFENVLNVLNVAAEGVSNMISGLKDLKQITSNIKLPSFGKTSDFIKKAFSKSKSFLIEKIDSVKYIMKDLTTKLKDTKAFNVANNIIGKIEKKFDDIKGTLNRMGISGYVDAIKRLTEEARQQLKSNIQNIIKEAKEISFEFVNNIKSQEELMDTILELQDEALRRFIKCRQCIDLMLKRSEKQKSVKNEKKTSSASISLQETMLEMTDTLQSQLQDAVSDLSENSPVQLTSSSYNIKNLLNRMSFQLKTAVSSFSTADSITSEFSSLESVLDTIIKLQEQMADYRTQKKINGFMAQLASSKTPWDIGNKELYNAINDLKFTMQASKLLTQHQRALHALKQYVFPFANHFLEEFTSHPSIDLGDDFKDILNTIIPQIKKLYSSLDDWTTGINHHDAFIYRNVIFTDFYNQPFYKFAYSSFNTTIQDILNGKVTRITADVRKSVDKEAVKFNKIRINFKLVDTNKQSQFDKVIRNYDVDMVHLGKNTYRCNKRYFAIPSERALISYSFENNEKGAPLRTNSVYDKLASSNYFLSPYTEWNIKLYNAVDNVDYLRKFLNESMDLLIEGRGQYLQINPELEKICDENIEKYYQEFAEDDEFTEIKILAKDY